MDHKLLMCRLDEQILRWTKNWVNGQIQRVVLRSMAPGWKPVTTGVSWESILCSVLFNISINDGAVYQQQFCYDSKLGGVTETPKGHAAIQRDLGKLEEWANRNVMKLSKEKYEVLLLERSNPVHQCVMGAIVSKGLMTFAVYAFHKHWVVKSVAENIMGAYAQAANGTKSQIWPCQSSTKTDTFHHNLPL